MTDVLNKKITLINRCTFISILLIKVYPLKIEKRYKKIVYEFYFELINIFLKLNKLGK